MTTPQRTTKVSKQKPLMYIGATDKSDNVAYQITLPRLYDSQQVVRHQARRYNMICCGRRWGKTTMAVNLLAECILAGQPVGWFAPNYKLLTELFRKELTHKTSELNLLQAEHLSSGH